MQDFSEIRVRGFNRWGVTMYEASGKCASSRVVGEFDSVKAANEVASALKVANPSYLLNLMEEQTREPSGIYYAYDAETNRRLMTALQQQPVEEYVIVAVKTHQIETKAFFATTLEEAARLKEKAEFDYETEFRIFSR